MPARITRWINERWPLDAVLRWSLVEEIPGGASYAYIFGSLVLLTFLLQIVTGVWQFLYFVPTTSRAYDSLNYLRLEVPFGWLIHGLHYWGASAMIILVGLHLSQVFIWGAYKNPRELTWVLGVIQLVLTLALGFTGPILPWDMRGYWEAEVGTSTAGTVPYLGIIAKNLLQGGAMLGQMTLSRFFFLHVAILPGLLLLSVALHLVAFRKTGISGPWKEAKRKDLGPFWPDQVYKDALMMLIIFVILVGLCAFGGTPFSGPADALETFYTPKPEWYFLFLYQTFKAFHGVFEPVGTIGIPLFVTLLLFLLPFYDRSSERSPFRRTTAMACYAVFVAWVIIFAIVGDYSKPAVVTASTTATPESGSTFSSDPSSQSTANIKQGAQLFTSLGCIGCHRVKRRGGIIGPELSAELLKGRSRQWLIIQIRDPKAHFPNSIMPSFTSITDRQLNDVVDFLLSIAQGKTASAEEKTSATPSATPSPGGPTAPLRAEVAGPRGSPGPASSVIGNADLGKYVFDQNCASCHGPQGTDKVQNPGSAAGTVPSLNPISPALFSKEAPTFTNNVDPYIQHGSRPVGPNPSLHMLPFGDDGSLTQQRIANVETYILSLNGVNRTQLIHPGLEPSYFFWLVLIVFGVALFGFRVWNGRRS